MPNWHSPLSVSVSSTAEMVTVMTVPGPIPTRYAGCLFRSRLEARWAVFFDSLDVRWQYEPEGFSLPSGRHYLPDFWLPDHQIWLEVKGVSAADDIEPAELDRWSEFAEISDPWFEVFAADGYATPGARPLPDQWRGRSLLAFGDIPDPRDPCGNTDSMLTCGDSHYKWTLCPQCKLLGAEFDGRAERLSCRCLGPDDETYNPDDALLCRAYAAARAARFEYGHRENW